MKGTRCKWVLSVSLVLAIWPVKTGIKLSKVEILALEAVGFRFPQRQVISPQQMFGGEVGFELVRTYLIPTLADDALRNSSR